MDFNSKRTSLVILGATAIICSRMLFFFLDDPEGPNLLVVAGLAIGVYILSCTAYLVNPARAKGIKRLAVAICIQILSIIALCFCLK